MIAAKYAGVELNVNTLSGLADAKTPAMLAKFPLGKVPSFEAKEGPLFESSAIAYYAAAHCEKLIGATPYEKASIVQWICFADQEFFATFAQWMYPILGYAPYDKAAHSKSVEPINKVLAALDKMLATRTFLVGECVTLADIILASNMFPAFTMFLDASARMSFVNVTRWFLTCANQAHFKAVFGEVKLAQAVAQYVAPKKEEAPKPAAAPAAAAAEEEEEAPKPKPKNAMDLLPPSTFNLEDWKRFYSNNDTRPTAIDYFWKNFDPAGFSIWRIDYKYNAELTRIFMTCNLITGLFARMGALHKYCFGSVLIFGEDNANEVSGYLVFRGQEIPDLMKDVADFDSFDFRRVDINDAKERELFNDYLAWDGELGGKKFAEGKTFK